MGNLLLGGLATVMPSSPNTFYLSIPVTTSCGITEADISNTQYHPALATVCPQNQFKQIVNNIQQGVRRNGPTRNFITGSYVLIFTGITLFVVGINLTEQGSFSPLIPCGIFALVMGIVLTVYLTKKYYSDNISLVSKLLIEETRDSSPLATWSYSFTPSSKRAAASAMLIVCVAGQFSPQGTSMLPQGGSIISGPMPGQGMPMNMLMNYNMNMNPAFMSSPGQEMMIPPPSYPGPPMSMNNNNNEVNERKPAPIAMPVYGELDNNNISKPPQTSDNVNQQEPEKQHLINISQESKPVEMAAPAKPVNHFCTHCGSPVVNVIDKSRFCGQCGHPLT